MRIAVLQWSLGSFNGSLVLLFVVSDMKNVVLCSLCYQRVTDMAFFAEDVPVLAR